MSDSRPPRLFVGASASLTRTASTEDVEALAKLTGDTNPIHLDSAYAARTQFGRRIAHGMLGAGYISAVLGTVLPGPGTIYLGQTLSFKAPIFIGDTITATVTVKEIRPDKPIMKLTTQCHNQDGVLVLDGEAVILYPPLQQAPQPQQT